LKKIGFQIKAPRSTNPSDWIADKRPAISKWSFIKPVLNFTVLSSIEASKKLDISPYFGQHNYLLACSGRQKHPRHL
jgi:hypothetical protein